MAQNGFFSWVLEIRPPKAVQNWAIKRTKPHGMTLVLSKVNMRSVDRNPPLISRYQLSFLNVQRFSGRIGVLSGAAMTDHQRRALLRRHEHQTRRCGCYRQQTRRTPLPRPILAADLGRNVSAAAAAACMSAGGRLWWWAVSRSRTPTTRCHADAYATVITPSV